MISLIIGVGGGEMDMLPEHGPRVDWVPVNYGAACLVDIVMHSSKRTSPPSERVHHILNPREISWIQLLEHLKSSGLQFKVVPTEEWIRQVLSNPKSPVYALAGYFNKTFGLGKTFEIARFNLEKTMHRTALLELCPLVDQKLLQCYLKYWSEIGFLKASSISSI
jgi:hypothetical protein